MLIPLLFVALASGYLLPESSTYSYYVLALQWKPTVCKSMTCVSGYYSVAFNIHGLWPSSSPSSGPSNCPGDAFSLSSSVKSLIESSWLSDSGAVETFWEHEWTKHGTCVVPSTTPDAFFTHVYNITKTLSIQTLLARGGISPSDTKTYEVTQVNSALPHKVILQCYCKSGVCYLENIEVCYDLNYEVMDCETVSNNCKNGEFLFPTSD